MLHAVHEQRPMTPIHHSRTAIRRDAAGVAGRMHSAVVSTAASAASGPRPVCFGNATSMTALTNDKQMRHTTDQIGLTANQAPCRVNLYDF